MRLSLHKYQRSRQQRSLFGSLCCLLLLSGLAACGSGNQQVTATPTSRVTNNIQCTEHSTQPVSLTMAYSSEKEVWISAAVKDFNSRQLTACDGAITVTATPLGSGQSMQQIVDGTLQPDIWSPAGSVWLSLLADQWQQKHPGAKLIATGATDTPSLVNSPVVIAMWKQQAKALGWPQKAIGWADIVKLSTDPQGWASYGHPEFGAFKFGHTHPGYSNSGLDAVIAMNYAATQKVRNLSNDDVNAATATTFVSSAESSVIHYGDSTGFFANKMFNNGPGYLSATVMYENLVIQANSGSTYPHLADQVVAIYPKEGTFMSDHPFVTLQASWVTPAQKAAALAFRNFLLAAPQQAQAMQDGFRPANPAIQLAAPINSSHGVDPSQPKTLLPVPSISVVNTILSNWQQEKRHTDVMLILDRSGSMNDQIGGETKIEGAKQGLKEFVNLLGDQDQVGLTIFNDQINVLTPVSLLGPKRGDLLNQIAGIQPNGSTLLFDTIAAQLQSLQSLPSKNIKAIVVLTDGLDTGSTMNIDQLDSKIASSGQEVGTGIKMFTIAYGGDADKSALTKIANTGGGQEYDGTPQNIQSIYNQISVFF